MKKKSKIIGCFSILALSIVALILSSLLRFFIPLSGFYSFAITLLSISLGVYIVSNRQYNFIFQNIGIIVFIFFVKNSSSTKHTTTSESDIAFNGSESIYKELLYEHGDSIPVYSQNRYWVDNYGNTYNRIFSVREKDYFNSQKEYKSYTEENVISDWGKLYHYLASNDAPNLDLIIKQLADIQKEKKLNKAAFAEMVVTFIQDIPYSLVFGQECLSADNYEYSIKKILDDCPECCIGNIPFGIQNPVAFMGNLKGDCDTRTVIIYALLNHFKYDVAILNSQHYKHSILGLNIPASGHYKTFRGKRYYTWETTNKHFTLGTLPQNFDNINHWEVVLTNNISSHAN